MVMKQTWTAEERCAANVLLINCVYLTEIAQVKHVVIPVIVVCLNSVVMER